MKIGIMSYWNTDQNYGQVLQCYALQQFLRNLGHNPFHIKYIPQPATLYGKILKLLKSICAGDVIKLYQIRKESKKQAPIPIIPAYKKRRFEDFKKKHIIFTDEPYSYKDLRATPPTAECYIAGSDQIWGTPDPGYLLDFGSNNAIRIAYAPSMGGIIASEGHMRYDFKRLLKKIDIITVREQDGVDQCRLLGRPDAELAPDPVFLLPAEYYRNIASYPTTNRPYVFLYIIGNRIGIDTEEFFKWANKNGCEVVYVTAHEREDKYPQSHPNIDEWIGLIDNAKYVFTNSFHGMVTGIILNKQFLAIPNIGIHSRMNSRLTTTLTQLGLQERIYRQALDEVIPPIDYERVNESILTQQNQMKQKFNSWLLPK